MEMFQSPAGDVQQLQLVGTIARKTTLSGSVSRGRGRHRANLLAADCRRGRSARAAQDAAILLSTDDQLITQPCGFASGHGHSSNQRAFPANGPRATAHFLTMPAQQLVSLDEPVTILADLISGVFLNRAIRGGIIWCLGSETQACQHSQAVRLEQEQDKRDRTAGSSLLPGRQSRGTA